MRCVQQYIQQYNLNDEQNTKQQEQKQSWQKVEYKKRTRDNPENTDCRKRQTFIKDYQLNKPIEISNSFEKLNEVETQDISKTSDISQKIEMKAPPIFVEGVATN